MKLRNPFKKLMIEEQTKQVFSDIAEGCYFIIEDMRFRKVAKDFVAICRLKKKNPPKIYVCVSIKGGIIKYREYNYE